MESTPSTVVAEVGEAQQLLGELKGMAERNRAIVKAIQEDIQQGIADGKLPDAKLLGRLEGLSEAASKQSSRYFKLAELHAPDLVGKVDEEARRVATIEGMHRERPKVEPT